MTKDRELKKEVRSILPASIGLKVTHRLEEAQGAGVVLLDVDSTSFGHLKHLRDTSFVIVITAQKGSRYLIESMTFGAFDCILRPLDPSRVTDTVERALGIKKEILKEILEVIKTPGESEDSSPTCAIVGDSPAMQEVCKLIGQVGRVDVPVLITGESGTGKELVAEAIWKVSSRWDKPYVAINCAAIPETLLEAELFGYEKGAFTGATSSRQGRFEEANGGVLFLDEIGDMSLNLQAKVLRVLQGGTFHRVGGNQEVGVNIRVIAATNKDLEAMVKQGHFREELYFRLNVVRIHLPPLWERKTDIPLLVQCFVHRYSHQMGKEIKGVSSSFLDTLIAHNWPGNVRELENAVRKAIAFAKTPYLTSYDLKGLDTGIGIGKTASSLFGEPLRRMARSMLSALKEKNDGNVYEQIIREAEKILLEEALTVAGGNRSQAARLLGINRLTLRRKMEEYSI